MFSPAADWIRMYLKAEVRNLVGGKDLRTKGMSPGRCARKVSRWEAHCTDAAMCGWKDEQGSRWMHGLTHENLRKEYQMCRWLARRCDGWRLASVALRRGKKVCREVEGWVGGIMCD